MEGTTEELIAKDLLVDHLAQRNVSLIPRPVWSSRSKRARGGNKWRWFLDDLRKCMREDHGSDARFTTLLDLYGLDTSFPDHARLMAMSDTNQRASEAEAAMAKTVADARFLPYIQRHEIEALVFVDLGKLRELADDPADLERLDHLMAVTSGMPPEDIDDGAASAPSKRLEACLPGTDGLRYRKTLHGPLVVHDIGLARIRAACPRFDQWVAKLEDFGG